MGTLLVPLLRDTLMKNVSERWHLVYLVPAIVGLLHGAVRLAVCQGNPHVFGKAHRLPQKPPRRNVNSKPRSKRKLIRRAA